MLKRLISITLWTLSEHSALIQRYFQGIGMRGKKEWVQNHFSRLRMPNKKNLLMAYPDLNYMTFALHWKGWSYHEPVTTLLLLELFKESSVFYDIGANVGYFSLIASSCNPALKVTSFEPNPKLNHILAKNVAINNLSISVESLAISDRDGEQLFYIAQSDMSSSLESGFRESVDEIVVQTAKLDHFAKNKLPAKDVLIKIDVEGHEAQVINGAMEVIEECRPEFILEIIGQSDICDVLAERGYRFYEIGREGLSEAQVSPVVLSDKGYANFFVTTRDTKFVSSLNTRLRPKIALLSQAQLSEASCY